jgi:hypothetical protein
MFDNPDLLAFLQTEEANAYDGTLLEDVETAINSYNGAEYGDEEDGRSQVVARDVSETIDYMLTSVLDAFVASGRIVEFEPTSEEVEDQADDATEAMHYIYRRKRGYQMMHDWAKAGLLEKIGIVKSCVEHKRKRVEQMIPSALLPGETEEELKAAGIIEAEEAGEELIEGVPMGMHRVVTLEQGPAAFPDYFVPLEEFRVSRDARDLDSAVYVAHICEKSLSELVEMGFDPDELADIRGDGDMGDPLRFARDDGREVAREDRAGALRKVWLLEEYILFDLNEDGIAERLCVHRVGNTILEVKEVDYQPFEYWCPYPMQGRLIGQSLADKVVDIQRVNTALERNALDSLYMSVAPGTLIHEDAIGPNTISDLLTVRPRRIVRWKGVTPPMPEGVNDISSIAFEAIEFKTRQRESRTGITRLNKGVDEDTLNETAKGQAQLMSRGQQMERYIIRNFAEGVARLFMKKVGLMRRYGQPFKIKVDGEYREVDPSQWPEDLEINIKVGLGSGSKDERIAYRNLIAQAHTVLKQGGSPLVSDENIYNNMTGFCKDAGLQPNDLFTHPEEVEPQEPQPDPKMIEVQIRAQETEAKIRQGDAKLEIDAAKAQAENERAERQMLFEMQMAEREFEQREREMRIRAVNDAREGDRRERETEGKFSQNRPGGRLDK